MTTTIEAANEQLRQAVQQRRDAQAAGRPHEQWYAESQPATDPLPHVAEGEEPQHNEWGYDDGLIQQARDYIDSIEEHKRLKGDGIQHEQRPGSLPFLDLLEELRQLHYEKTSQYGGATDPFENVTASAKCGVEPWRRALCDLSDCVVRMQRYANGQPVDYENALIDAANWSLICLLKLREANRA
jgi:hypothetical protein